MTRWHQLDLTGRVIKASEVRGGDQWEVITLPAVDEYETPLWPEFWKKEELDALRATIPISKWSAQYQQDPTSEEGALIKREHWNMWDQKNPPACEFILQTVDTAHTKNARSDYSAITTWGVFNYPDENGIYVPNIILLDAVNEKLEFPELKRKCFELYEDYQPDAFLVEAKAAGFPLIQEMRAVGLPVSEYSPSRGQDKLSRVNAVSDTSSPTELSGHHAPDGPKEVIEQCAAFPNGAHDDLVDSTTLALLRFRQGGFIPLATDFEDEPSWMNIPSRSAAYY